MAKARPIYEQQADGSVAEYWCALHQDCLSNAEMSLLCYESRNGIVASEPRPQQRADKPRSHTYAALYAMTPTTFRQRAKRRLYDRHFTRVAP